MKILIVEDEESIREVIKKYLLRAGFEVEEAASGEVALLKFNSSTGLVILDLNLPNKDGLEICQAFRKKSKAPIIIVTARTEETDEFKGLNLGADDYIKKPFSPKILVSRVQAILRRMAEKPIVSNDLVIDADKMTILKRGVKIPLTTTQFKILRALAENPGKIFTREELITLAGRNNHPEPTMERTVDAHIKMIRKLIEDDPQNPKYIKTLIGSGYKYNNESA